MRAGPDPIDKIAIGVIIAAFIVGLALVSGLVVLVWAAAAALWRAIA